VRAGVFLTNMTELRRDEWHLRKIFQSALSARTTIAAAALPLGACVEIDLVVKA